MATPCTAPLLFDVSKGEPPSPNAAAVAAAAAAAAASAAALGGADASSTEWQATLASVCKAVVVLKITATKSFDTEVAGSSYATGFVVDAARGILLTNRHVVKPGPVLAEAVFLNREEIPVQALYRDPVHDFGFFKFDPRALQFMEVTEIPLAPEAAQVGLEVRVVGNDSGEKLSILSGTIARLDREAPFYAKTGYNDENTFYLQAASGTKGGSSGSPVVDVRGRAVGLNAGSKTKSASAFFLPLERVARALALLRAPLPPGFVAAPAIPRGTLQATFTFRGFDELRRLGLRHATEAAVRDAAVGAAQPHTGLTGLLVVESAVPGGPADGALESGDIVLKLNGRYLFDFLGLESVLDDGVGGEVTLDTERGGVARSLTLRVGDLHAATPARFLEAWGGVLHALSYQQARNFRAPTGLAYVAEPGYCLGQAGVPRHAILVSVAGTPTPGVHAAAAALAALPSGARVPLQYYTFADRHRVKSCLLTVSSHWYGPLTFFDRDDVSGLWHATEVAPPAAATPRRDTSPRSGAAASPAAAKQLHAESDAEGAERGAKRARTGAASAGGSPSGGVAGFIGSLLGAAFSARSPPPTTTTPAAAAAPASAEAAPFADEDPLIARVAASLVQLSVDIPPVGLADGVLGRAFKGCGVVVAHTPGGRGLVLTDRNTAPIAALDARLSFAAHPSDVPARVCYLHPVHNYALLEYDASALPPAAAAAVRAAALDAAPLARGDAVTLLGLSASLRPLSRRSRVTDPAHALAISPAEVPRFRATNEEVVELDDDFGASFSGVLLDDAGAVRCLWASYSKQVAKDDDREFVRGLPAALLAPAVAAAAARLAAGAPAAPPTAERFLDVELEPVHLAKAGGFGLPPPWVAALAAADPARRQALRVAGVPLGSPARDVLKEGDFLLQVDGATVTSFCDVERAAAKAAAAAADEGEPAVAVTLWRGGSELRCGGVGLAAACPLGTRRLLHWAGAQLQATHRAVNELGFAPPAPDAPPGAPPPPGVFVSRWHHGSPAQRWGLYALHWIVAVNGTPTPDLDSFVAAVAPLRHGDDVRLATVALNTKPKVLTLKLDTHYWPTYELACDAAGHWRRTEL